jgi:hypothetical protein
MDHYEVLISIYAISIFPDERPNELIHVLTAICLEARWRLRMDGGGRVEDYRI